MQYQSFLKTLRHCEYFYEYEQITGSRTAVDRLRTRTTLSDRMTGSTVQGGERPIDGVREGGRAMAEDIKACGSC